MALVTSTSSLGGLAGSNALARLLVVISGDSTPLQSALASAEGSIKGFGANAGKIGSAMTRSLTLPILALGGASIYMASEFQSAMARVAGLSPILDESGQTIEGLSERMLSLSQIVPTAPTDLANSLYFAGSAGLKAADALEVVEMSARGAAIGMGEASDLAKVLIFALNTYGEPAGGPLKAADAMDALTAAIREGTAEPAEMGVALGRLLPVAKEAGVTFEEVVGSVAALTNLGMPARVATTSLRALFAQLLGPTRQGEEAMNALGLTAEQVLSVLRTTGPIGVFALLEDAVDGDQRALRDILPQIRAYTAYLGLTENEMIKTKRIFEATTNSTGALQRAFNEISKTPAFKFEIGLNKLRVAAIRMGNQAMPIFLALVEILKAVGDAIANLPDILQKGVVAFAALVAAAGPLIKLWAALGLANGRLFSSFGTVTTGLVTMGVAAIGAYAGFQALMDGSDNLLIVLGTGIATFTAVTLALKAVEAIALKTTSSLLGMRAAMLGVGARAGWIGLALSAAAVAATYLWGRMRETAAGARELSKSLNDAAIAGSSFAEFLEEAPEGPILGVIEQVAHLQNLLGQPVPKALPDAIAGMGQLAEEAIYPMDQLIAQGLEQGTVTAEGAKNWEAWSNAVKTAMARGDGLRSTFTSMGLSYDEFVNALKTSINLESTNQVWDDQYKRILNVTEAYGFLLRANEDYQASQLASVMATAEGQAALQQYATELGVSSSYLEKRLGEFGISAIGMDETTKAAFEDAAGVVDQTTGEMSLAAAEAADAIAESSKNISESILGSFQPFEKLPETVKKTTGELLKLIENQSQMILEESANLKILAERGVPTAVLEMLAEQGPQYVAKFVNASDRELQRLITATEVVIGATSDTILQGVLEFQPAGSQAVAAFTRGMLDSSQVPTKVAQDIIRDVTVAFAQGKVRERGLQLAVQFAHGLGSVKNLSQKEASQAMQYFAREIERRNLTQVGGNVARELARGLQQEAGVSKQAAQRMVESVLSGVRSTSAAKTPLEGKMLRNEFGQGVTEGNMSDKGSELAREVNNGLMTGRVLASTTGLGTGQAYAASLKAPGNLEAAYAAGVAVAHAGNRGLEDGAKNSPEYYSYYLGQRIASSLWDGMTRIGPRDVRYPGFRFPGGSANYGRLLDGGHPREVMVDLDLDVKIERSKVAREIEYHYAGRGR